MICKHCGKSVEEGLVSCPDCAKKLTEKEYKPIHRILAVLGIVAVVAVNVWVLWYIANLR